MQLLQQSVILKLFYLYIYISKKDFLPSSGVYPELTIYFSSLVKLQNQSDQPNREHLKQAVKKELIHVVADAKMVSENPGHSINPYQPVAFQYSSYSILCVRGPQQ